MRQFKVSTDPKFAEKTREIIGLYMNPPDRAVALSIDEKTRIQALGRTRKGLPMKPGRPATMTHDYKRNGTTTLFAAMNILDGTAIGCHSDRHRRQEFIALHNEKEAKPFKWTASPDRLIAARQRGFQMIRTNH